MGRHVGRHVLGVRGEEGKTGTESEVLSNAFAG